MPDVRRFFVVVRHDCVEEGEIARFFQIGAHRQDDPQVIVAVVVGAVAHLERVAFAGFHRQRIKLVVGGAVRPLDAQQLDDQLLRFGGHMRQHAHHILRAVAHADPARS